MPKSGSIMILVCYDGSVDAQAAIDRAGLLMAGSNLQTLVELGVDKNSTVVFPAPLMSTIQELGAFLSRESKAATELSTPSALPTPASNGDRVSS